MARLVETIVKRRKEIVAAWVIVMVLFIPFIMGYSNFISYSSNSSATTGSESYKAQLILLKKMPQNSTLDVIISSNKTLDELANDTLLFQNQIAHSNISYFSGSDSVYTSYENFINSIALSFLNQTRLLYVNLTKASVYTYSYAESFYSAWKSYNFSSSYLVKAEEDANRSVPTNSKFISLFLGLVEMGSQDENKLTLIQGAAQLAALETAKPSDLFFVSFAVKYLNITNYRTNLVSALQLTLEQITKQNISEKLIISILSSDNPGFYYVSHFGLSGAPGFLLQRYVSKDNTTQIVLINFNVSESFRGKNNFYPAQQATPIIRQIASKYFGSNALVTGQGAVAYDSQQLSSSSGFVFGLTFVFLAVAVAITLGSLISPLLALLFVSLETALGYVSIYVTGLIFGSVDFTVTYTLTAVVLGVGTDYLVFLLSRFKEELKNGKSKEESLKISLENAGEAVVISGITVAGSLGSLSLLPDLRTWGPVLSISVLMSVVLTVTLLPSIMYYLGGRIFLKRTLTVKSNYKNGWVYRAAHFSVKRKKIVALLILVSFIPSFYIWANLPTTYNISEGLPKDLESVRTLNTINNKFGSDVIFPLFVIANTSDPIFQNNTISQQALRELDQIAYSINSTPGISNVIGPYGNMTRANIQQALAFQINQKQYYFIATSKYDPYSENSLNAVERLRNQGFLVAGLSSTIYDLKQYYGNAFLQLEVLIIIVIAIILGLSLKSYSFPLISLSGVMISITWTTSLLYIITKYLTSQSIVFLVPVVLFVILMSLGNDFTVFILTRVKEETEKDRKEGLLRAMSGSGRVVTSLGIILAFSLGSLAAVPFGFLEQVGIAFAVSLLLDTFIIRTFYFPAVISLISRVGKKSTKNPQ